MTTTHRTTRDLRRGNRATVLRRLYFAGPSSRLDLAASTGLSPATVGNVMSELMRDKIVIETGQLDSDGGRPAVLVKVNPDHAAVIGVDVGETGAAIELFDLNLRKLAAVEKPVRLPQESPGSLVALIAKGVNELIKETGAPARRLRGIGVGVPGVVVHDGEDYVHAPSLGWDKIPLLQLLQAALPAPVMLDNGAKTMGRAELWFGACRDARHLAVVLLGTGVGAALFNDGALYRGSTSSAGEWGHTSVIVGGRRCRCGASGCLEAYVGAEGILERWAQRTRRTMRIKRDQQRQMRELLEAARTSKPAADVLEETAEFIGAGMANLVNLFNPECIVIGGWVGQLIGPGLLPRIREIAATRALRYPFSHVAIELGRLGPDAVAMGAATLIVERFLADGGRVSAGRANRGPEASLTHGGAIGDLRERLGSVTGFNSISSQWEEAIQ
jgi:predicted NBD/HSP70 family sugar kinase